MIEPPFHKASDDTPRSRADRLILWGFCLFIFGGFALDLLLPFQAEKLSAPFFLLWWCVLTVVHEFAHAFVALRVGWTVEEIQLGFGRTIWRSRIAGAPVNVKAFPIVGLVRIIPANLESPRLKTALIYGAGPGVELLIALGVNLFLGTSTLMSPTTDVSVIALQSLALAAVTGALLNLMPFSPNPGTMTDGYALLRTPFLPRVYFESLMLGPVLTSAEQMLSRGEAKEAEAVLSDALEDHPDVLLLHAGHARALLALGRGEEGLLHLQAFVRSRPAHLREEAERALALFRGELRGRPYPRYE